VVEASAGSNALYVDDYGRVGLGTSTPAVELEVRDGDTPSVRLNQDGSSGWSPQTWDLAGNEANFFIRDATNGSQLPFRIQPGADSNALTIKSNNSVGFGTWSPDDGGGAERFIEVKSDSQSARVVVDSADGAGNFGELLFQRANNNEWSFGNEDSQFYIYNYGFGDYAFRIDTATNDVTITQDLTITGQCTEADGACAPDYVFEPDYELLTLQELREYITEYKHLPNVPSADEIEANGINMRAFNFALLEKIEELTLYTLQQEQTIKELEAFIKQNKHLPNLPAESDLWEAVAINNSQSQMVLLEKIEELTLYTLQQQQIIEEFEARLEALEGAK
jgi:hypothetical protein